MPCQQYLLTNTDGKYFGALVGHIEIRGPTGPTLVHSHPMQGWMFRRTNSETGPDLPTHFS